MKGRFRGAPVASLMLAGLLWACGCGFAARAQVSASLPSSLPPQTVYLDYRELGYSVGIFGIAVNLQTTPFKKEPNLGGNGLTRGILKFGNSSEHFVAFILDRPRAKLYLDLNRNQDLTDDTNGVFTCTDKATISYYQAFRNIPLTFKTPAGTQKALVDLGFYNYGYPNNFSVQAECRYCWEAKASFQGRDYQFALVDNLSGKLGSPEAGYLVLRPWTARTQPLSVQDGSLDGFPFTRNLFFAGQTYRLDSTLLQRDGALCYQVTLNPQASELGDLKLTGKHLHRVLLTRDGGPQLTVVLDAPRPLERVPRAVYHYDLTLRAGDVEAHPVKNWGPGANPSLSIAGTNAALLAAGGPLTNTVAVNRNGRNLALNYRLIGLGGQAYELAGARTEPEWSVHRADKQLAAGKFQFG